MEYLSIAAQLGTILTGLSVIFVVVKFSKEMQHQNLQSLFYLHKYLSQDEFSISRHKIRTDLHDSPYQDWSDDDKRAANKVCTSYDQAGMRITAGILNKKTKETFLSSSWGESICDQFEILQDYLNDKQTPRRTGRDFFCHFCELYKETAQYHR